MLGLTPEEIDEVRQSFDRLWPVSTQTVDAFYDRLFVLAPELRPLFASDMDEQKRKFISTLAMIVGSLEKTPILVPATEKLAREHVDYGVQPAHYDVVGEALLWSLEQALGPHWTRDVAQAWLKAYRALSAHMVDHAYS